MYTRMKGLSLRQSQKRENIRIKSKKLRCKRAAKGRKLTENRFDKGFGVMVSHLRQQLKREDEAVQPIEFFNELIKNKVEFKIWVVKRTIDGRQRTNVNFLEPIAETVPNTEVVDDE